MSRITRFWRHLTQQHFAVCRNISCANEVALVASGNHVAILRRFAATRSRLKQTDRLDHYNSTLKSVKPYGALVSYETICLFLGETSDCLFVYCHEPRRLSSFVVQHKVSGSHI